jgi:hypothetical protein
MLTDIKLNRQDIIYPSTQFAFLQPGFASHFKILSATSFLRISNKGRGNPQKKNNLENIQGRTHACLF